MNKLVLFAILTVAAFGVEVSDHLEAGDCLLFGPYSTDSFAVNYTIYGSGLFDVGFTYSDDNCSDIIEEVSVIGKVEHPIIFFSDAFFFAEDFMFIIRNKEDYPINVSGFFSLTTPKLSAAIASWVWYVVGVAGLAIMTAVIAVWRSCKNGATVKALLAKRIPTPLRTF